MLDVMTAESTVDYLAGKLAVHSVALSAPAMVDKKAALKGLSSAERWE